jgi:enoyl-CoA hydratase/carnithine racemase
MLTGRTLSAGDAEKWGLVTEVVHARMAESRATELAGALAAMPLDSLRATKRSLRASLEHDLEWSLQREVVETEPLLNRELFHRF